MSLFSELKRRNVFRVSAAYVVAAWVIIQVADLVLENIGAPDWVIQTLMFVLALGFLLTAMISWTYEVTSEGIKRETAAPVHEVYKHEKIKRLDIITIVLLVVAIGILLSGHPWTQPNDRAPDLGQSVVESQTETVSDPSTETDQVVIEQSIAVLPFIALSADEDDAYFGKGVAEELLNALAKFPTLKVAARTSAFSIAEEDRDLREVGEMLNVAHVLEGSVRRSGDRVRITAQLIRAEDGFHLWSETFERRFTDIFQIQDEIVAELSRVLQIRLGIGAGAGRAAHFQVNPEAYELYLRGLDFWWTRAVTGHRVAAIEAFLHVTELDPDFADGWAAYAASLALSNASFYPHLKPENAVDVMSAAFATALELDPNNARALAGLVYFHVNRQIDIPRANQFLQRAFEAAPNHGFTHYSAAQFYFSVGDEMRSTRAIKRAMLADPLNQTLRRIEFQHEAAFGHYAADSPILDELEGCQSTECDSGQWLIAWAAMAAALHAADEARLRRMRDIFQGVNERLGARGFGPDVYEFLMNYCDSVLDIENAEYWSNSDFMGMESVGVVASDASILAQRGQSEMALTILENVANNGRFFASRGVSYVLWPGRFEIPEHIRRHPRYHAIWALPGMPEIELARRANGMTAGLPLSVEQTEP